MNKEKSCGGIVFRKNQGTFEFIIIQQRQGNHWFFPKGHVEEGETEEETALREIHEEIGFDVRILPGFKETLTYIIGDRSAEKMVVFFLCEVTGGTFVMSDELLSCVWLDYEHALQQLSQDNSKALLTKVYAFLSGK